MQGYGVQCVSIRSRGFNSEEAEPASFDDPLHATHLLSFMAFSMLVWLDDLRNVLNNDQLLPWQLLFILCENST